MFRAAVRHTKSTINGSQSNPVQGVMSGVKEMGRAVSAMAHDIKETASHEVKDHTKNLRSEIPHVKEEIRHTTHKVTENAGSIAQSMSAGVHKVTERISTVTDKITGRAMSALSGHELPGFQGPPEAYVGKQDGNPRIPVSKVEAQLRPENVRQQQRTMAARQAQGARLADQQQRRAFATASGRSSNGSSNFMFGTANASDSMRDHQVYPQGSPAAPHPPSQPYRPSTPMFASSPENDTLRGAQMMTASSEVEKAKSREEMLAQRTGAYLPHSAPEGPATKRNSNSRFTARGERSNQSTDPLCDAPEGGMAGGSWGASGSKSFSQVKDESAWATRDSRHSDGKAFHSEANDFDVAGTHMVQQAKKAQGMKARASEAERNSQNATHQQRRSISTPNWGSIRAGDDWAANHNVNQDVRLRGGGDFSDQGVRMNAHQGGYERRSNQYTTSHVPAGDISRARVDPALATFISDLQAVINSHKATTTSDKQLLGMLKDSVLSRSAMDAAFDTRQALSKEVMSALSRCEGASTELKRSLRSFVDAASHPEHARHEHADRRHENERIIERAMQERDKRGQTLSEDRGGHSKHMGSVYEQKRFIGSSSNRNSDGTVKSPPGEGAFVTEKIYPAHTIHSHHPHNRVLSAGDSSSSPRGRDGIDHNQDGAFSSSSQVGGMNTMSAAFLRHPSDPRKVGMGVASGQQTFSSVSDAERMEPQNRARERMGDDARSFESDRNHPPKVGFGQGDTMNNIYSFNKTATMRSKSTGASSSSSSNRFMNEEFDAYRRDSSDFNPEQQERCEQAMAKMNASASRYTEYPSSERFGTYNDVMRKHSGEGFREAVEHQLAEEAMKSATLRNKLSDDVMPKKTSSKGKSSSSSADMTGMGQRRTFMTFSQALLAASFSAPRMASSSNRDGMDSAARRAGDILEESLLREAKTGAYEGAGGNFVPRPGSNRPSPRSGEGMERDSHMGTQRSTPPSSSNFQGMSQQQQQYEQQDRVKGTFERLKDSIRAFANSTPADRQAKSFGAPSSSHDSHTSQPRSFSNDSSYGVSSRMRDDWVNHSFPEDTSPSAYRNSPINKGRDGELPNTDWSKKKLV